MSLLANAIKLVARRLGAGDTGQINLVGQNFRGVSSPITRSTAQGALPNLIGQTFSREAGLYSGAGISSSNLSAGTPYLTALKNLSSRLLREQEEKARKAQSTTQAPNPSSPYNTGVPGTITERPRNGDPAAFFAWGLPFAQQAAQATGLNLPPEILLAIAASESNYGLADTFGGVKAQPHEITPENIAAGLVREYDTWEMINGQRVNTRAWFRTDSDPVRAFSQFGTFLQQNPRYAAALQRYQQTQDPAQLLRDVNQAGYATDPNWANNVLGIAERARAQLQSMAPMSNRQSVSGAMASQLLAKAHEWLQAGVPYVWGGQSRQGADCSGLIYGIMQELGRPLPARARTAQGQWEYSQRIRPEEVRPGDLVFFHSTYGNAGPNYATHVGIVTEQGVMLHTGTPGRPPSIVSFQDAYWSPKLMGFGRLP